MADMIDRLIKNDLVEEKVYLVEFLQFTNYMNNTVKIVDEKATNHDTYYYMNIPEHGLLVRESQLEEYRQFGGGYKSIKLVGSMYF